MEQPLSDGGYLLQSGATTGVGKTYDLSGSTREAALYVVWSAGVTGGEVIVETAHDGGYAGTWAPLAGPVSGAASKQDVVPLSGVLKAVRARISATVIGGTVTVYLYAN